MSETIVAHVEQIRTMAAAADAHGYAADLAENGYTGEGRPGADVPTAHRAKVEQLVADRQRKFSNRSNKQDPPVRPPKDVLRDEFVSKVEQLQVELRRRPAISVEVIKAAAADPLSAETRVARRNLSAVWGAILFGLVGTGFAPEGAEVFGLPFDAGIYLAAALTGLLAYHWYMFWQYSRAGAAGPEAARATLRREIDAAEAAIEELAIHENRVYRQWDDIKQEHAAWHDAAVERLQEAEGYYTRIISRAHMELLLPNLGALLAFLGLWATAVVRHVGARVPWGGGRPRGRLGCDGQLTRRSGGQAGALVLQRWRPGRDSGPHTGPGAQTKTAQRNRRAVVSACNQAGAKERT